LILITEALTLYQIHSVRIFGFKTMTGKNDNSSATEGKIEPKLSVNFVLGGSIKSVKQRKLGVMIN
jgi:hypothetical protein